jgi:hypothetical protein
MSLIIEQTLHLAGYNCPIESIAVARCINAGDSPGIGITTGNASCGRG